MKTKVIHTRLFPSRSRFAAITLFGFVFAPKGRKINQQLLNHERIHCRQQLEWLYIPFFIIYFFEWLFYLIKYRNRDKAYRAISFEREAYAHGHDLSYLSRRRCYANYRRLTP